MHFPTNVHKDCALVTAEEAKDIAEFHYQFCEFERGVLTQWRKGKELTSSQLEMKRNNYFDVKEISGNRIKKDGQRDFYVVWALQGSRPYWQPEENLDGCVNLLNQYCRNKEIPRIKIEALLGSTQ